MILKIKAKYCIRRIFLSIFDLAKEQNQIVAFVLGIVSITNEVDKLSNDCAKTWNVLELVIKNTFHGNGIGRQLLNKIETYFSDIGCKRINIEVFGPNKKALDFYLKNDYTIRDYIVSKKI